MVKDKSIARSDILVVDDNKANLELLVNILSEAGYKVRPASSGKLALRSARAKPPTLILLDIKMPDIDGYEICCQIKATKETNGIPIIFITVLDNEDEKLKGFQAGAVDYITKPINKEELLARVYSHTQLRNLQLNMESHNVQLEELNRNLEMEITERKRTEEHLLVANRLYTLLSDTNQAIVRIKERGELFHAICKIAIDTGKFRMAWIGMVDEESGAVQPVAHYGYEQGFLQEVAFNINGSEASKTPTACALKEGKVIIVSDISKSTSTARFCDESLKRGYCSLAVVPIKLTGRPVVCLTIFADTVDFFTDKQLKLLEEIGGDVSYALNSMELESKRKKAERELATVNLRQQAMLAAIPDIIMEVDASKVYTWANQAGVEFFGEGVIGKEANYYFEGEQETYNVVQPLFSGDENIIYIESWQRRKDGQKRLLGWWCRVLKDKDGKVIGVLSTAHDITEAKQVEEKLANSEVRYRRLFETAQDAILILDGNTGKITDANPFIKDLLGYSLEELKGKNLWEIGELKDTLASKLSSQQLHESGYVRYEHLPLVTKDGQTIAVEVVANAYMVDHTKVIQCNIRDVTERKRTEDALRESEERFRTIASNTPDHIIVQDYDLRYISVINPQLGLTQADMIGKRDEDFLEKDDAEKLTGIKKKVMEAALPISLETSLRNLKGGNDYFEGAYIPKFDLSGKVNGLIGYFRNITGRKLVEERLLESKRLLDDITRGITEDILIISDDYKISWANEAASNKYSSGGTKAILGDYCYRVTHGLTSPCNNPPNSEPCPIMMSRRTGKLALVTHRHLDSAGNSRIMEVSAYPVMNETGKVNYYIHVASDITDKKQLEEERLRIAKLESIGTLAAGIAHDFNNILTAILGNISLAKMKTHTGDEVHTWLEGAEKASIRAKDLTQQLLTFAKGGAPVKKLASLSELLKDTASFAVSGSNIKCQFSMRDDLWHAEIDEGQISQMINNLVINAQQAMPIGGTIEVRAENITLTGEQSLSKILPLKTGNYIRIAVIDQGIGIPEAHLEKIFDPFFTTKQKGSGLGLATSFSIVRNHGGHISVESKPNIGSTFYVYLPASTETITTSMMGKREITPLGNFKVLVMDDEETVREVAGNMLKHIGAGDIQFAADGNESIKLYEEAMKTGKPFDVVILDLTIPGGMGGKETIKNLIRIDPNVKAIVSSGYSSDPITSDYKESGFSGVIDKPYTVEQLQKELHHLIG